MGGKQKQQRFSPGMLGDGFLSGQGQGQGQPPMAPLLQHQMSNEPLTSGLPSPMSDAGGA